MLKLKLQYFGHVMRRADSLEKTLMLGKIEGKRRRGRQRMRWLDSPTITAVCSNSCPLSQWCYLTISFSAAFFSCCPQSFPASGSFPVSQLFTSNGQSTAASGSASVLPVNAQDWFPLGLTGLITLQSKGLSRVFSSTRVWRHQFFGSQSSLWSSSHIQTWLQEKP